MASGFPGGHAPNLATEFATQNPIFSSSQLPNGCAFVSNAGAPQIADYGLIAGLGFFLASAVTPQGQANAAEYTFGTHAQAIHQAEAVKSRIWGSVRTPPAAASAAPLRSIWASPESIDLSIGGWVVGGTQVNQGPVPPTILAAPQDTTQIAAQVWKSQPAAAVVTPNPVATFFSVPPQTEDRPARAVWQSLRAGQTPPIIASFYAAPQSADLTQQGIIIKSAQTPPAIGPVPPITVGTPQTDPSQVAPQIWSSAQTPPAIAGITVWPTLVVPAQFDTSINPTVLWTTSTFSSGLTPPIPQIPDVVPDVIRNFSLRDWRKWHRPEDERELRKLRITPAVAEVIAEVAERQAEQLDLDEQQRLEELTRKLELKGLQWHGRYLELLNAQRQQLIDEEIGRLMRQKQAEAQRRDEEAILLFLMIS